jgi:hypothetical protein
MDEFQIENTDSTQYILQNYSKKDTNLLDPIQINKEFGEANDVVEFFILSPSGDILEQNYDFKDYTNKNTVNNTSLFNIVELNPDQDLLNRGYDKGEFDLIYNFTRLLFSSSFSSQFFIKEISRDRTELKISSNDLEYLALQSSYIDYITKRNQRNFYSDFSLNFGENQKIIGVNIALDNINTDIPSLYIKLYEPLPSNYSIKDTLWVEESISEPISYHLKKDLVIDNNENKIYLKGPNFDIAVNQQISTTTPYLNLSNIIDNSTTSSFNKVQSLLKDNIQVNIDYNTYSNFIHFSSARERFNNFLYKLNQINKIESDINILANLSSSIDRSSISSSLITLKKQTDNIIQNFDGYESFLYYESSSNSFPKSSSIKPYILFNPTSSVALEWIGSDNEQSQYYGGKKLETSNYDISNKDYLWNNLPEYIKYDDQNSQLELIISMMGQHFDYIWTYIKDITNKPQADNRLNYGISKDLVAEALKSFGIKLYTNSRNNQNIYSSLLGENPDGTFLPYTGSYLIENYITSSNYTTPDNDIVKETYKRLYHNLPFLLKSKGTKKGIRAIINCFGIPETILNVRNFGGNIKSLDLIENTEDKFNYSLSLNPSSSLRVPFLPSYKHYLDTSFTNVLPTSMEFRFKLHSVLPTQSLFEDDINNKIIRVTHTSGTYANINFGIKSGSLFIYSSPILLPLYNNDWWTVSLSRNYINPSNLSTPSNYTFTLNIGNKDKYGIQYFESSSITSSVNWTSSLNSYLGGNNINHPFSGSFQEFRYWINEIPSQSFKDHILNPKSYSYLNETGSYNNLIFRVPLGAELDIENENAVFPSSSKIIYSVHPSEIPSFIDNLTPLSYATLNNFSSSKFDINYEEYLINTPNYGSYTETNDKVKIIETKTLPDNTLSINTSILKKSFDIQTKNSSKLEVGISPQNSLNDDIIKQLGNFNIDDYIGNPNDYNKSYYPELNELKDFYFQKIESKINLFDSIKLLSYLDNSLFKMIKDWIPAKSNVSSGFIIKPTILERNKVQRFEPELDITKYYEGNIITAFISGSDGSDSSLNTFNTQSFQTEIGLISKINDDNKELYNGEFSGSLITIYENPLENIIYEFNNIELDDQDIIENYSRLKLNPILNNLEESRKSNKRFKLDYNDIKSPTNINYITESLYYNINNDIIKASIQDSNYTLKRHINPRYIGNKLSSKEYNYYNDGDNSYGKSSVIDKNYTNFSSFEEITDQQKTLPGRSNVYIKYLIDTNSNITELTKQNKNLFDVQTLFDSKSDIVLDDNKFPSIQNKLDGVTNIFAGGFRYEPVFQNIVGTHKNITYTYTNDILIPNTGNTSGSKQNLDDNSIIINGNPYISPSITHPSINQLESSVLNVGLDSNIIFPVIRNTGYTGNIIQRISGSVEVTVYVSPSTYLITQLFSEVDFTGQSWQVQGADNLWAGMTSPSPTTGNNIAGSLNNILSIKVPAGVRAVLTNAGGGQTNTFNGPINYSSPPLNPPFFFGFPPLSRNSSGVDYVDINIVSCSLTMNVIQQYNNLSNNLPVLEYLELDTTTNIYNSTVFNNSFSTPLDLTVVNGVGIKIKFDVDGYIELPENVNSAQLALKTPTGIDGLIKSGILFNCVNPLAPIQFTQPPTTNFYVSQVDSPFYYDTPPSFIYINQANDNGYISGSESNYYFKRGIYLNNQWNILTASYDLSNTYYNSLNTNNTFIQTFPTFSHLGYEDIDNIFKIKVGDLVRLYNEDKDSFPIEYEREILHIIEPTNPPQTSSIDATNRLFIILDDYIPNQSCFDTSAAPTNIQNIIILSKVEDETNIVINKSKKTGETSPGIIIPFNTSPELKSKSGNIIKQLKNQNLI